MVELKLQKVLLSWFLSAGSTTKLSTLSDSNDDDDEDEGNYVNVHDGMQTD